MNMNMKSFYAVLKALHQYEVDYILVGGLAVIFHGVSRITKDVDIFVKRDSANLEKLRQALHSVFQDESIKEITIEELQAYPVIRYGTPHDYYIDILDRIGTMFSYDDLKYEIIETEGIPVKVATIESLIKLKQGTIRLRDQADVMFLMEKLREKK